MDGKVHRSREHKNNLPPRIMKRHRPIHRDTNTRKPMPNHSSPNVRASVPQISSNTVSLKSGFSVLWNAYKNGSSEVRRLLLQDCSLIYECNACRNLFRNITNFLSHKRMFCQRTCQDEMSGSITSSGVVPSAGGGHSSETNYQMMNGIAPIKGVMMANSNQMSPLQHDPPFSTPFIEPEMELIVHGKDSPPPSCPNGQNILQSAHNHVQGMQMNGGHPNPEQFVSNTFICETCHLQFDSQESLSIHYQRQHHSSTCIYQCPTCTKVFFDRESVIEHLSVEHKKPMKRMRKDRPVALKELPNSMDQCSNVPSLELERLQLTDSGENRDNGFLNNLDAIGASSTGGLLNPEQGLPNGITIKNEYPAISIDDSDHNGEEEMVNNVTPMQEYQRHLADVGGNLLTASDNQQENVETDHNGKSVMKKNTGNTSKRRKFNYKLAKRTFTLGHTIDDPANCLEDSIVKKEISNIDLLSPEIELGVDNSVELSDTFNNSLINGNGLNDDELGDNLLEDMGTRPQKKTRKTTKLLDSMLEPRSQKPRCRCKICNKQFNALSNLRRHISMFHYRARRFGCSFCEYRAFRRYDILNHLVSVHKMSAEHKETMSAQFVSVYDVPYTNMDMEGDIILVTEADEIIDDGEGLHTNRKRRKRKRAETVEVNDTSNEESNYIDANEMEETISNLPEGKQNGVVDVNRAIAMGNNETGAEAMVEVKVEADVEAEAEAEAETVAVAEVVVKEEKKKATGSKRKVGGSTAVIEVDSDSQQSPVAKTSTARNRSRSRRNTSTNVRNTLNSSLNVPVKITRYRLRSDPLLPANKNLVKDFANRLYRSVVGRGMAAPSTMPEIPTERPQMRPRLTSICYRSDAPSVPVIDSSDLKAASLKAEILDDTFLDKLVNPTNSSFRMKPLLALQQSPLTAILKKYDVKGAASRIHRTTSNSPNGQHSDQNSSYSSSQRESSEEPITISSKLISKLSAKAKLNSSSSRHANDDGKPNHSVNSPVTTESIVRQTNDKIEFNEKETETEKEKEKVEAKDVIDNVKINSTMEDSLDISATSVTKVNHVNGRRLTTRLSLSGRHSKVMNNSVEELLTLGRRGASADMITPDNKLMTAEREVPPIGPKKRISLMKRLNSKSGHENGLHSDIEQ